jgi:hypothetical protein
MTPSCVDRRKEGVCVEPLEYRSWAPRCGTARRELRPGGDLGLRRAESFRPDRQGSLGSSPAAVGLSDLRPVRPGGRLTAQAKQAPAPPAAACVIFWKVRRSAQTPIQAIRGVLARRRYLRTRAGDSHFGAHRVPATPIKQRPLPRRMPHANIRRRAAPGLEVRRNLRRGCFIPAVENASIQPATTSP